MTPPDSFAGRPKLLGTRSTRIRVAVGSTVLLATGALLAPAPSPTSVPASQEHAAPLLEEQMQPRAESQPLRRLEDLAPRVRQHGVALLAAAPPPALRNDFSGSSSRRAPSAPGVVVADGFILTHAAALDGRATVEVSSIDGATGQAEVAAYDPATGLVLLKASGIQALPAIPAVAVPVPGTLVAGVESSAGSVAIAPIFISTVTGDRYRLSASYGGILAGTPLFTVDGELVAIAGPDGDGFSAAHALKDLSARAAAGERLASIGIAFQELTPALNQVFGEGGVLISAVVEGAPADLAGVRPGDVLTAVGTSQVDSPDAAIRLLRTLAPLVASTLTVRRERRQRTFDVAPAFAYDVAALSRAEAERPEAGLPIRGVLSTAFAYRGIPHDARILAVNGLDVTSRAQAIREIARRRPVLLLLRHRSGQFFAIVEPLR
jgi:S1-C subfamily serine protease